MSSVTCFCCGIQNPNNTGLPVSGLRYVVSLNGQEFARGTSNQHFTVPALGESVVSVTVSSTAFDWIKQVDALQRPGAASGLSYDLSGRIFLSGPGQSLDFRRSGALAGIR